MASFLFRDTEIRVRTLTSPGLSLRELGFEGGRRHRLAYAGGEEGSRGGNQDTSLDVQTLVGLIQHIKVLNQSRLTEPIVLTAVAVSWNG